MPGAGTRTTVLSVAIVLVLSLAIMYLFTRIRRQDRILDKQRRQHDQQLQDQDVVQIVEQYMHGPRGRQQFQQVSDLYAQHYANSYLTQLTQLYSQQQQQQQQQLAEAETPPAPQPITAPADVEPTDAEQQKTPVVESVEETAVVDKDVGDTEKGSGSGAKRNHHKKKNKKTSSSTTPPTS